MMESMLFGDLITQEVPSVFNSPELTQQGTFIGEAKIQRKDDNGLYEVACHGATYPKCRPVFNMGENIFPIGIPVFVIAQNGEGWILGRMRPIKDTEENDGKTTLEASSNIGTQGDALLKPHSKDDKDPAYIRVTRGNIVNVRSTNTTNITLHPHNELVRISCQRLLEFTDAYRIESGRVAGNKGGIKLDALTTETYVNRVGPSRIEVKISNGKVSNDLVHSFQLRDVTTGAGTTAGTVNFGWSIDEDGNWDVNNLKTLILGGTGEPMVLGQTLKEFLIALIGQVIQPHLSASASMLSTVTSTFSQMAGVSTNPIDSISKYFFLLQKASASLSGQSSGLSSAVSAAPSVKQQYLTSNNILSDFIETQKSAPSPSTIVE